MLFLLNSGRTKGLILISIEALQNKLASFGHRFDIKDFQEATANLISRVYRIEGGGELVNLNIAVSATYHNIDINRRIVQIELSKTIGQYLFHLKENFTTDQWTSRKDE
jgi:hypothetical protein